MVRNSDEPFPQTLRKFFRKTRFGQAEQAAVFYRKIDDGSYAADNLAYTRCQRGAPDSPMQNPDKNKIQPNVG